MAPKVIDGDGWEIEEKRAEPKYDPKTEKKPRNLVPKHTTSDKSLENIPELSNFSVGKEEDLSEVIKLNSDDKCYDNKWGLDMNESNRYVTFGRYLICYGQIDGNDVYKVGVKSGPSTKDFILSKDDVCREDVIDILNFLARTYHVKREDVRYQPFITLGPLS